MCRVCLCMFLNYCLQSPYIHEGNNCVNCIVFRDAPGNSRTVQSRQVSRQTDGLFPETLLGMQEQFNLDRYQGSLFPAMFLALSVLDILICFSDSNI